MWDAGLVRSTSAPRRDRNESRGNHQRKQRYDQGRKWPQSRVRTTSRMSGSRGEWDEGRRDGDGGFKDHRRGETKVEGERAGGMRWLDSGWTRQTTRIYAVVILDVSLEICACFRACICCFPRCMRLLPFRVCFPGCMRYAPVYLFIISLARLCLWEARCMRLVLFHQASYRHSLAICAGFHNRMNHISIPGQLAQQHLSHTCSTRIVQGKEQKRRMSRTWQHDEKTEDII